MAGLANQIVYVYICLYICAPLCAIYMSMYDIWCVRTNQSMSFDVFAQWHVAPTDISTRHHTTPCTPAMPCHANEWVMSHTRMSHVIYTNQSSHTEQTPHHTVCAMAHRAYDACRSNNWSGENTSICARATAVLKTVNVSQATVYRVAKTHRMF